MLLPPILMLKVALLLVIMGILVVISMQRIAQYQSWSLFNTACSLFFLGCFGLLMSLVGLGLKDTTVYTLMAWISFLSGGMVWIGYYFTPVSLHVKELQLVYTGIADLAVLIDYNGQIISANHPEQFKLLFSNSTSLEEMLIVLANKSSDPVFDSKKTASWELHLSEGDRDLLISLFPVTHRHSILGKVLLLHDITELKLSERNVVLSNQELQKANDQLNHYIHMSHLLEVEQHRVHVVTHIQNKIVDTIRQVIERINNEECDAALLAKRLRTVYQDTRKTIREVFTKGANSSDTGVNS